MFKSIVVVYFVLAFLAPVGAYCNYEIEFCPKEPVPGFTNESIGFSTPLMCSVGKLSTSFFPGYGKIEEHKGERAYGEQRIRKACLDEMAAKGRNSWCHRRQLPGSKIVELGCGCPEEKHIICCRSHHVCNRYRKGQQDVTEGDKLFQLFNVYRELLYLGEVKELKPSTTPPPWKRRRRLLT